MLVRWMWHNNLWEEGLLTWLTFEMYYRPNEPFILRARDLVPAPPPPPAAPPPPRLPWPLRLRAHAAPTIARALANLPKSHLPRGRGAGNRWVVWLVGARDECEGELARRGWLAEVLAALCPAIVLDDGVEARAIGHRGQRFFTESINHFYQGGPPPGAPPEDEDAAEYLKNQGEAFVAYLHEEKVEAGTEATGLYNPNHAYGTVEDAIGYV